LPELPDDIVPSVEEQAVADIDDSASTRMMKTEETLACGFMANS
jgi:hypothetical protein